MEQRHLIPVTEVKLANIIREGVRTSCRSRRDARCAPVTSQTWCRHRVFPTWHIRVTNKR